MFSKIGRSTTVVNILLVGLPSPQIFFFLIYNTVIFVVVNRIEVY